jgi:hypothetical protein
MAARRQGVAHLPIANRLWDYIEEQAATLNGAAGALRDQT